MLAKDFIDEFDKFCIANDLENRKVLRGQDSLSSKDEYLNKAA